MPANTPRLTKIYYFLTYQCRIPLAPDNYMDLLVLLALSAMCIVLCIGNGGEDPAVLARAARLCAAALGFHLLALAWRARSGFNLHSGSLLFLPWLLWCALDWGFFSPKPWLAETHFIANCMAFIAFSVSLHHFRNPLLKWVIGAIIVTFVVLMTGIALGQEVRLLSFLKGRIDFHPLGGTLKRPVAIGAVLLLVFFPCFAVALGLRWRHWQRLLAAGASVVLLLGILVTARVGVITGLFIGILITSFLLTRKLTTRAALIIPAAFVLLGFSGLVPYDTGFNRSVTEYDIALDDRREAALKAVPIGKEPPPEEPAFSFPRAALQAGLGKPLQGQGTGGFATYFEKIRPIAWKDTPRSPGSLPLAFFAENGLLGSLLFFTPVAWLWISALNACSALPRRERRQKKPELERQSPPVPEDRLFLSAALAGSTAAGIALLFDYPGAMPAVACLFALLAGAIHRHAHSVPFSVPAGWNKELALIAAAVLVPVAWLLWTRPPLKSASFAEKAYAAVTGTLPDIESSRAAPLPDSELTARLNFAESNARQSIRANPRNADAWHALALTALRRFEKRPDQGPVLGALALHATQRALEISPDIFEFHLTRGHALQMTSDERAALREYEEALQLAPGNAAAALDYAALLSRDGTSFARDKAHGVLRTALANNPRNEALLQRLNLLRLGTTTGKQPLTAPDAATQTTPTTETTNP